jgi:hypothetical protein
MAKQRRWAVGGGVSGTCEEGSVRQAQSPIHDVGFICNAWYWHPIVAHSGPWTTSHPAHSPHSG